MERKFRDIMLERSGAERLKMGCSMHTTSKMLVKTFLLVKDPSSSPDKLMQALFLHFYGKDFEASRRKRILLSLRQAAEHNRKRRNKVKNALT